MLRGLPTLEPMADMPVIITGDQGTLYSAFTNELGAYRVSGLVPDTYMVAVVAAGPAGQQTVAIAALDDPEQTADLHVSYAATLTGVVADADGDGGLLYDFADLLGRAGGFVGARLRQYEGEFVPAVSSCDRTTGNDLVQCPPNLPQNTTADQVAVLIINRFEMVKVQKNQAAF